MCSLSGCDSVYLFFLSFVFSLMVIVFWLKMRLFCLLTENVLLRFLSWQTIIVFTSQASGLSSLASNEIKWKYAFSFVQRNVKQLTATYPQHGKKATFKHSSLACLCFCELIWHHLFRCHRNKDQIKIFVKSKWKRNIWWKQSPLPNCRFTKTSITFTLILQTNNT